MQEGYYKLRKFYKAVGYNFSKEFTLHFFQGTCHIEIMIDGSRANFLNRMRNLANSISFIYILY